MKQQFKLRMTLEGPYGRSWQVTMPINEFIARDRYVDINPPSIFDFTPGKSGMDILVERIRTREFRKQDFERTATRMGIMLAERMEDEEGWHDISRQEFYENQRRNPHDR